MTAIRVNLAASFGALLLASAPLQLGRSEGGRPIVAMSVGNPHGTVVLVVGCIHGNEGAGIAVARLRRSVSALTGTRQIRRGSH